MSTEAPELEITQGQRHIIERPRLTKLLDESNARVILLVAPAGYGKTTLARQWVASRPHAWYTATAASADTAAFAHGLLRGARSLLPKKASTVTDSLRASSGTALPNDLVAKLLAEDFAKWPDGAWLAIDDYHFISETEAEEIVSQLARTPDIRLLIASRRRPGWVSPRTLIYGDVVEIDQAGLALTFDEGARLLGATTKDAAAILEHAGGWPVLVALSARLDEPVRLRTELPNDLYEYLANELLATCSHDFRTLAPYLGLAPPLPAAIWVDVHESAGVAIPEAGELGIATVVEDARVEVHPLFRDFLFERLIREGSSQREEVAQHLFRVLLAAEMWDEAYAVAKRADTPALVVDLVPVALDALLEEGRLATLDTWIGTPGVPDVPVIRLARAEVEFRKGSYLRAQVAATEAAREPSLTASQLVKCHYRAGMAAYFREDFDSARNHLELALNESAGPTHAEVLRALILIDLPTNPAAARTRIQEYEGLEATTATEAVKKAGVRALAGYHLGALDEAIMASREATHLLVDVPDPMVRTSFRNSLGHALSLAGWYRDALAMAAEQLEEIETFRLQFARVHTLLDMARAEAGLGHFGRARELVGHASRIGRSDAFVRWNVAAQQAKLAAAMPIAPPQSDPGKSVPPYVASEFFAAKSLLLAVQGDGEGSKRAYALSEGVNIAEVETLRAWARALVQRGETDGFDCLVAALTTTHRTGAWDTALVSIRAHPSLLADIECAASQEVRHRISLLLAEAGEVSRAQRHGFTLAGMLAKDHLSPREREVLNLVADGSTNRQIAQALFISEATVKVHVRHIFEKLGVASRTQAARRAFEERID